MKKFFYVLLTILIIFTLVSCSEKSKSENDKTTEFEKTKTEDTKSEEETKAKMPKDILRDFVLQNGAYNEEDNQYYFYKNATSAEETTAYFGIFYNQKDDIISFAFYKHYDSEKEAKTIVTTADLESNQNDSAMDVALMAKSETEKYDITALGKIYPEQVSMENLEIHNIDYYLNESIPLSDPEITSLIDSLFDLELKKLILYLYATLEEIPDITIQDLGFTNMVSVTK